MKKILTLDTWVLFLFIILPVICPDSIMLPLFFIWSFIALFLTYCIGVNLYEKLPANHDLNKNRFVFNLAFIAVYIVFLIIAGVTFHLIDNLDKHPALLLVIIPGHLYAGFSIFYSIYFLAKTISTIETKDLVKFDGYAVNFLLILFIPLGIWRIWPKVRRILR